MVHLVTGFANEPHIGAEDDGSRNAGTFGLSKYVLGTGSKFAATIISNNLVRVADGDLVDQGRHIKIPVNSYEELTISNGTGGMNRNDLIVMRYEKNTSSGIETAKMDVIKGTAATTASDPSYTTGDILGGDYVDEFPLYRVKIEGLTITAVEPMFDVLMSMEELQNKFNELNSNSTKNKVWSSANNITLTNYNKTTPYKVSCDGYLRVNIWAASSSASVGTFIIDSNSEGIATTIVYSTTVSTISLFIKKGMRLYATVSGSANAIFYPLVNE